MIVSKDVSPFFKYSNLVFGPFDVFFDDEGTVRVDARFVCYRMSVGSRPVTSRSRQSC